MSANPVYTVAVAKMALVIGCLIDGFDPAGLFADWRAQYRPLLANSHVPGYPSAVLGLRTAGKGRYFFKQQG